MSKRNQEELKPESTEQVAEPTVVTELTTKQKIEKMLVDKQAAAKAAVEAAQKQAEEADALANVSIDDEVEGLIDNIKLIDDEVTAKKAAMNEELKPLNEQIESVKLRYNFDEANKMRADTLASLVAKVGEAGAKVLVSGGGSTGTGTGKRGRSGASREQVIQAVCDEKLTFAQAAEKHDHKGSKERTGEQKVGFLVGRHIALAVAEGTVIKNTDGSYSRA